MGEESMQIAVFDSGLGGMTVLHDLIKRMPDEDYIYYADTAHVPYGTKPKEEVRKYIFEAMDFIVQQGVKAIVIACNTATSVAVQGLREKYKDLPIIGMEPAVKPALEKKSQPGRRVFVTATALTLREEKLHNLIAKLDGENIVDLLPLPGLVELAEKFSFDEKAVRPYLEEVFGPYHLSDYDAIVLGCTHFPFFKDTFRKILPPEMAIIDGNIGTIKNLQHQLKERNALGGGSGQIVYYNSSIQLQDGKMLEQYKGLLKRLDSLEI